MSDAAPAPAAPMSPKTVEIKFEQPIQRQSGLVETVTLRKPSAGELRGLNIQDIMQSDVNAMMALIPRIAVPFLTQQEMEGLDSSDFAEMAGAVVGFFYSPAQKAMIAKVFGAGL